MTFTIPAEYEPHRSCWLLWPERPDNWRDNARPAQEIFRLLISAIAGFEKVYVGANRDRVPHVELMLPKSVTVLEVEFDDVWIRDTGPICVRNSQGGLLGLHWAFNSWGGLFESWERDRKVASRVLTIENIDEIVLDVILEGGAINVDGQGTLVATEECLLNPNRNPGLTKRDYESLFFHHLGIEKVIWIPQGLFADETGGHIDNLCVFTRPAHLVVAWTDDTSDPQHEISKEAIHVLSSARDARGRQLSLHKLSLPSVQRISAEESSGFAKATGAISRKSGDRLAASYVNFCLLNGGVIVPTFDDPKDSEAIATLQTLFPDRRIVAIPSREIVLGGGGPHCVTARIPA